MAIEVLTLPVYFPESQLQASRAALRFILAGAELGMGHNADELVEGRDHLTTVLNSANTDRSYYFSLTGEQRPEYVAGLLFISDEEAVTKEIVDLLKDEDSDYYEGEFWPTLLEIKNTASGVVTAEAKIALHTYAEYSEQPPKEFENLRQRAAAGENRLTVSGMMKYLASL